MEATFGDIQSPFAAREPKQTFNVRGFIKDYQRSTVSTVEIIASRSSKMINALEQMASNIVKRFLEYARVAIEVAASKFLVELCAMIIVGVGSMAHGKNQKPIDISTAGVYYTTPGVATAAQPQAQMPLQSMTQPSWASSPFDTSWPPSSARAAGSW